ncbi:uncharacterized protein MKZ38_000402 [Zalerion maritima]|uniref:Phosphoglycerate mutase family protein n=1 Tax=Zalerion maritima TaxID=339359 RepID=A0AAD5RY45_9PEZI|nr:uncharacterized protein MKZ38_000402 [Zalerion maritima]
MPTTIHLVRHAQGIHNLCPENHKYRDPDLTELGHQQCANLKSLFPDHGKVRYLIASPLRRTIYTALESFTPFDPSSPAAQKTKGSPPVIATPLLQEVSTNPCDYGSEVSKLRQEFGEKADLSRVTDDDDWLNKDKGSPWAPDYTRLRTRAMQARTWFRELSGGADTDVHIVVVTHGGFLHFLTDDFDGLSETYGTGWNNTECRSYHFADLTGKDPEAHLKETNASWRKRRGSQIPLTESEHMEMRAVVKEVLRTEFAPWNESDEVAVEA